MKPLHYLALIFLLTSICSCSQTISHKPNYPLHVGDSEFNEKLDDPNFQACNPDSIFQYYNFGKGLQYKGEKIKIEEHFSQLKTAKPNTQSGFITIRFIVNCKGKTGRYRVQEMDSLYAEKKFSEEFTAGYLRLTKQLNGWEVGQLEGKAYDYYQYLTFKIENGQLKEIMP